MIAQDPEEIVAEVRVAVALAARFAAAFVRHRFPRLALAQEGSKQTEAAASAVARELGLSLDFRKPEAAGEDRAQRYALTLIARTLGPADLHVVSGILAAHGANIERIHRLSEGGLACVEFAISLEGEVAALERALLAAAGKGAFDCALQRETLLRRSKRLIVMDMDSTLIRIEVIDELARAHGVGELILTFTGRDAPGIS